MPKMYTRDRDDREPVVPIKIGKGHKYLAIQTRSYATRSSTKKAGGSGPLPAVMPKGLRMLAKH